jgi:hypothetical protein
MTARKHPTPLTGAWARPEGYFTEPCRAWWGEHWQPFGGWGANEIARAQAAVRGRDAQLAAGYTGSIAGISKASAASIQLYAERAAKGRK